MEYYAGIDVSLDTASVCIVDGTGKVLREAKIASEPDALVIWFRGLGFVLERIGMEAGWLCQRILAHFADEFWPTPLPQVRAARAAALTTRLAFLLLLSFR
jgi:transposase